MRSFLLLLMFVSSASVVTHAQEPARIALLIGNQGYNASVGPLRNPHNDVALLSAALEKLGFKTTLVRDADYRAIDIALKLHVQQVRHAGSGTISFFYYSGHGAANPDSRVNYLIPVDVLDADDEHLWEQSFELNDIIGRLRAQSSNATHYVIFDACRDELRLTGRRALGMSKGFTPVDNVAGVMVAYATAPGRSASDGGRGGGPYARALAEEIVRPGVEAVEMFRSVQRKVKRAISQDPWLTFPTLPAVYFAGREAKPAASPPASLAQQPAVSEARQAWLEVKDTTNRSILEAYIKQFGDTVYGAMARARLDDLLTVASVPTKSVPPSTQKPEPETPARVAVQTNPAPAPNTSPSPTKSCSGESVLVGASNEHRCMTPGAGKTEWFKDCPNCPDMVVVPAGRFMMGSPEAEVGRAGENETLVEVTIAKPFAVARFAVTRSEFATFVKETNHKMDGGCSLWNGSDFDVQTDRSWRSTGFSQDDRHPVVCVNWHDARSYAAWLAKATRKSYRLLSEAAREYVTRAGRTTPFWWGSSITTDKANYDGNYSYGDGPKGDYRQRTVAVDAFTANGWGLFNVHGNVWEWAEDCWNSDNTGNPGDGSARASGDCSFRVVRGGSWSSYPRYLRSALRGRNGAKVRALNYGFRVVRTLN